MRTGSADAAVAGIAPGDHVALGGGAGLPLRFCEALAACASDLRDVTIHQTLALGPQPHLEAGAQVATFFAQSGPVADAIADGRIHFVPAHFSRMAAALGRIDHLVVQVAPERSGSYPYAAFVGYLDALLDRARQVVCEINDRAPALAGASIPSARVTTSYETSYPLPELPVGRAEAGTPEARVAERVADLVPDGATLQLGFGRITDCVVAQLSGRAHLGLHTETFTDAVIPLLESGALDNSRKHHRPGTSVCSLVMGSARLYDFLDGRDDVEMLPVETTNDPAVVATNDDVVAVNSALQVDLWGQANVEVLGGRQIGGLGGQVDFARGAVASRGGRFVLAVTSTVRGGRASRIVPQLEGPVSTSRNDVDLVVTEHGVADLRGASLRQRATALLGVADPDHREELERGACALGLR